MRKFLLFCVMLPFGVNAQLITTFAGTGVQGYSGDSGLATKATLNNPFGVICDKKGNLLIADYRNNVVRKVDVHGIITTIAGDTSSVVSGDGGMAIAAGVPNPASLAMDDTGNLYIAEPWNNIIRKVDTFGTISTFAGNGTSNFSGDGGPANVASLSLPFGIAIDKADNMYIAETHNSRIRKITKNGIISTIAGNGSFWDIGENIPAKNAVLDAPEYIAVDDIGNIYFSDQENLVRKIDTAGIISTVAGTFGDLVPGYSGDGGPATLAKFDTPEGLFVDTGGNLYIADMLNNRIRKVNKAGIVETVVGNGGTGYYGGGGLTIGDGGPAILASLNQPTGLTIDQSGNLYIADRVDNVVRMVNNISAGVSAIMASNSDLVIYPNPAANDIMIRSSASQKQALLHIYDMNGKLMQNQELQFQDGLAIFHTEIVPGIYGLQIADEKGQVKTTKLVIER